MHKPSVSHNTHFSHPHRDGTKTAHIRSRRAILHVLEDLEQSNTALTAKTHEIIATSDRLLQKNAIDSAILESIGDGIIVTDSSRIITFVNHAFEMLTGFSAAEVIGRDIIYVVPIENDHGHTGNQFISIINDVLKGNAYRSDITKPFYNVRKDKSRFPTNSTITPVWLHGAVIGLVKTFRDITKEMDIDKAKTEFVSLASHQLRTPLSAINWYTEMLLSGDVGPLTSGQEKYLREVYEGNKRMTSLVNAILNVTRMTLGTFVLVPEMIDLINLCESVLREQRSESEKKHLVISTIFEPALPHIESDAKLLRMVMQNLISNAIKYTPKGGAINISLGLDPTGEQFLFTVADSGVGIPINQQERIFSRLFRADNVRIDNTEGNGLGLYIVKAIVESSGGRVWFESVESHGSTFYIALPVSTPH